MASKIDIRSVINPPSTAYRISLEEEVSEAYSQMDSSQANASDDLDSIKRLFDTTDVIEDVVDLSKDVKEASPVDLCLVKCVANMSVAGTDIDSEKIINISNQALESMHGKAISLEGMKDSVVNLIKKIIEYVRRIWGHIKDFWNSFANVEKANADKVEAAREKISSCVGKTYTATAIPMIMSGASHKGKYVASGAEFIKELKVFLEVAKVVTDGNLKAVRDAGGAIASILVDTTLDNVEHQVKMLVKFYAEEKYFNYIGATYKSKASDIFYGKDYYVTQSPDFLGDKRIIFRHLAKKPDNDYDTLVQLAACGTKLVGSYGTNVRQDLNHTIPALKIDEMKEIIDLIEKINETFSASFSITKGIEGTVTHIDKACVGLSEIWSKAYQETNSATSEETNHKLALLKELARSDVIYAKMAQEPIIPFVRVYKHVADAAYAMIKHSCATYS